MRSVSISVIFFILSICFVYSQEKPRTAISKYSFTQIMENGNSISVGGAHTQIIKDDGTLWSFGRNSHGELGDGTVVHKYIPTLIMDNVLKVASGALFSMILKNDGSIWTTGSNTYGQLGDGTQLDKSTPVQIFIE